MNFIKTNIKKILMGLGLISTAFAAGVSLDDAKIKYVIAPFERTDAYIQVRIKQDTEVGQFNDSLYYTPEQWFNATTSEIDAKKQERVDNWVNIVKNPPIYVPPTKVELNELKKQLEGKIQDINFQLLDAK